ncbi:hypothetical protein VPH35_055912 [Triticum aestivum]
MEAGGAAGGRQPLVVIVVAGAGAATVQIRAVACVHLVLGLAAATFALCVTTLHPQMKQQGAACAATEDEENAVAMRTHGLLLLLSAGTQAATATVAALAPVSWRPSPRIFAAFAHAVSILTYFHFINAFVAGAFGSYPVRVQADSAEFIAHYGLLIVPLCVFFGIGVRALVDP